MDDRQAARIALACLDLTRLGEDDTPADIERLCRRASGPHGSVAALCVWPRLAAQARACAPSGVRVAAVANFPDGGADVQRSLRDVRQAAEAGAHEVDVVMPWRALLAGDDAACHTLLRAVRRACEGLVLKVIVESGELRSDAAIRHASELALAEGADFLKTSSGKTAVGATPAAARVMLEAIRAAGAAAGFKASGGIRTVGDARLYLELAQHILGPGALTPTRLRLGASGLLDDIEAVLSGRSSAAGAGAGT